VADHGGYVPKHLGSAPRPSFARPTLLIAAAGLAVGGLALMGPKDEDLATTPLVDGGSDAPLEDLDVCIRASLEDRVGLVLVVGIPGVTTASDPLVDELAEVGVAGVMLRDDNIEDVDQVEELIAGLRARLGEHLLVAVDDEGGRVTSMTALDEPVRSARRLGQEGPEAAHDFGLELGQLAASVGIDWVLAPVADLDDGPAAGVIGDRSFGADPTVTTDAARAFAAGLHEAGVAATAKHFPGHGGAGDPHDGQTIDPTTADDLAASDLLPFQGLIADGVEATMVGHVTYPALWGDAPASLAPGAYQLLHDQGFDGVAITDALGMGAVHARYGFDMAPAMAVAAGADAVLVNQGDQVLVLRDGLLAAVHDGRLDDTRLDDAVRHVLALRGQDPDGVVCDRATAAGT
jgi:beta-N-acetylhexosaminidase